MMAKPNFTPTELAEAVEARLVNKILHPTLPLILLNYTQSAQAAWNWTPVVRQCRGLIIDRDFNIVARPFPKFFTYDQYKDSGWRLPQGPFETTEKLDGSLLIAYQSDDGPAGATRGSFEGPQAVIGTKLLRESLTVSLPTDRTYLFEVIYPANRILVNFDDSSFLSLLAVIDIETGRTLPMEDIGFRHVTIYPDADDLKELLKEDRPNHEGYVIRFLDSDERVKIKHPWYIAATRLLRFCTPLATWRVLSRGEDIDQILTEHPLPPEYREQIEQYTANLRAEYTGMEEKCRYNLDDVLADYQIKATSGAVQRKLIAREMKLFKFEAIMWCMLDGKDYSGLIWKHLRPKGKEHILHDGSQQ